MAWSGGTYTKGNNSSGGWSGDAALGIGIEAGRHDTQDDDFATGIDTCLTKDGSNAATANLPMGGFKHTNVADAAARNQYLSAGQLQDGAIIWCGTSSGTAGAQTLTPSPAITAYATGQRFLFIAGYNNAAAMTLNVSGIGAKNVFLSTTNAAAPANWIRANWLYEVIYDGTQFKVLNESASGLAINGYNNLGASTGTANAIVVSPTIPLLGYPSPGLFYFFANATNTGAVTIAVSGLAAINLNNRAGAALKAGQINSGLMYLIYINGSNAYLLNPSRGALTWTPSVTQSSAVTSSNAESYYYIDYDNATVTATCKLTMTGAGTGNNTVTVSIPVNFASSTQQHIIGSGIVYDASTNTIYNSAMSPSGANSVYFITDTSGGAAWGVAPNLALASSDLLSFTITYRI